MSAALQALAALLGAAAAGFAVAALAAGWRAVRIGGARLLFNGWDWFAMSDRVPLAARPHMQATLRRWGCAMGCMLLGGIAAALSGAAA